MTLWRVTVFVVAVCGGGIGGFALAAMADFDDWRGNLVAGGGALIITSAILLLLY